MGDHLQRDMTLSSNARREMDSFETRSMHVGGEEKYMEILTRAMLG